LHSQTIQAINETHAKSRKQFKKAKLNWRTNNPNSKRKSLGWIPFKKSAIKHPAIRQSGKKALKSTLQLSLAKGQKLILDLWDSYNLSLYQINTCELVQGSRNRWYACITVKDYPKTQCGAGSVGIDLGLKTVPPPQTVINYKSNKHSNTPKRYPPLNVPKTNSVSKQSMPKSKIQG